VPLSLYIYGLFSHTFSSPEHKMPNGMLIYKERSESFVAESSSVWKDRGQFDITSVTLIMPVPVAARSKA